MKIWQLFIVLRQPVANSVADFSNLTKLTKLTNYLFYLSYRKTKLSLIQFFNRIDRWEGKISELDNNNNISWVYSHR